MVIEDVEISLAPAPIPTIEDGVPLTLIIAITTGAVLALGGGYFGRGMYLASKRKKETNVDLD